MRRPGSSLSDLNGMQSGQQFDGDTLVSLASTLAQSEATLAEYSTKRPRANAAPMPAGYTAGAAS